MRSDWDDPAVIVRAVFGGALVVATAVLLGLLFATGKWDWRWFAFAATMWALWAAFHDVLSLVVRPLSGFVGRALTSGLDDSPPPITMDEETVYLERLLQAPLTRHREILAAVRLAEIYRTHQQNQAKSDELLARLRAKYPEAPELRNVLAPPPAA